MERPGSGASTVPARGTRAVGGCRGPLFWISQTTLACIDRSGRVDDGANVQGDDGDAIVGVEIAVVLITLDLVHLDALEDAIAGLETAFNHDRVGRMQAHMVDARRCDTGVGTDGGPVKPPMIAPIGPKRNGAAGPVNRSTGSSRGILK